MHARILWQSSCSQCKENETLHVLGQALYAKDTQDTCSIFYYLLFSK